MIPISIVILSHNRLDEISRNIPYLLSEKSTTDEFEIIVVDNNSTDGSREFLSKLKQKHPEIILVLNDVNKGVAGGRNSGFVMAKRDFILALDDDSSISIKDLRRIPSLFDKYNNAGLLAFRVIHPFTGNIENPYGDVPCEVANHHGAGFAFRRDIFKIIGGIDEGCNFGAEELDFAIRVHAQGWEILYMPELNIYHNSFDRDPETEKFRRIRRQFNNVRIYHKYFPEKMALRNSHRYALIAIKCWLIIYGFKDLNKMITAYTNGRKTGLSTHQIIPEKTLAYYDNINLRPEFGNFPLHRKVINYFRRQNNN